MTTNECSSCPRWIGMYFEVEVLLRATIGAIINPFLCSPSQRFVKKLSCMYLIRGEKPYQVPLVWFSAIFLLQQLFTGNYCPFNWEVFIMMWGLWGRRVRQAAVVGSEKRLTMHSELRESIARKTRWISKMIRFTQGSIDSTKGTSPMMKKWPLL